MVGSQMMMVTEVGGYNSDHLKRWWEPVPIVPTRYTPDFMLPHQEPDLHDQGYIATFLSLGRHGQFEAERR